MPSWPDHEKTFAELQERIRKTTDFVQTFKAAQIDGSEDRDVKVSIAGQPVSFKGQPYLIQFVLPNFYFHTTMAYAILRHNGVELGKRDFVGAVPGMGVIGQPNGRPTPHLRGAGQLVRRVSSTGHARAWRASATPRRRSGS